MGCKYNDSSAHVAREEVGQNKALARVVHRILPVEGRRAIGLHERRRARARDDARVRVVAEGHDVLRLVLLPRDEERLHLLGLGLRVRVGLGLGLGLGLRLGLGLGLGLGAIG